MPAPLLTPAPRLETDRMAGIILPAEITGQPQQIIMVKAGPSRIPFILAAKKYGYDTSPVDVGDHEIEAFLLPPQKLAKTAFWRDAGIPAYRLDERIFYIDVADADQVARQHAIFSKNFPDAMKSLSSEAMIANRFGETVLDTHSGRAVRTPKGQLLYASSFPDHAGRFFLANDAASFRECAAHIAHAILKGKAFNRAELAKLLEKAGIDDSLSADFREELEAQLASRLALPAAQSALSASAMRANDNLPGIGEERSGSRMLFQQYSTPYPVAAALQSALQITKDDRVLEPTYGNGTLAAYAVGSGASVTGVELEETRFTRAKAAHPNSDIRQGDFLTVAGSLADDYSCVIANPPFETLQESVSIKVGSIGQSFKTDKLEHAIAITALEKLTAGPDGRAFIVLPASNVIEPNKLRGPAERFDLYARMAFDKVSVVQLDGPLYKKMGTSYPVLLYALEHKRDGDNYRPLSEAVAERVSDLTTIRTWDELFSWASEFGADRAAHMASRKDTEIEAKPNSSSPSPSTDTATQPNPVPVPAPVTPQPIPVPVGADTPAPNETADELVWHVIDDEQAKARSVYYGEESNLTRFGTYEISQRVAGGRFGLYVPNGDGFPIDLFNEIEPAKALAESHFQNLIEAGKARLPEPEAPTTTNAGSEPSSSIAGPEGQGRDDNAFPRRSGNSGSQRKRSSGNPVTKPVAEPVTPDNLEEDEALPIDETIVEPDEVGFELPEMELFNDLEGDGYTLRYESRSQVGEPTTVIQKSLQGLIAQSLRNLELARDMTVDDFVRQKLGISDAQQFAEKFSPEQVDALALAFDRKEKGRGFLNGDLMGVGKGRFLGGCASEALRNDEAVIFMTEKAPLFQDFFGRDLAHVLDKPAEEYIGNEVKLAVFNESRAAIKNASDTVIHKTSALDIAEWRDTGISTEKNVIALTYSQFQNKTGEWKLEAIRNWTESQRREGRKVTLLLDEVHKAAGDTSTTGLRTTKLVEAIDAAGGMVVYSSGTPLKSGKNIRVYKMILPETGLSTDQLTAVIETNPLALQEILSTEIAREGGMISREISAINAIREFVPLADIDEDRMNEVRDAVDRAATHLAKLVELGELAKEVATNTARREFGGRAAGEAKMRVETTSPVSQFHHYSQYLMLAVKGAFLRDLTAQAIASGEKVVIALENTGDALLDSIIQEAIEHDRLIDGRVVLDRLPSIGTVLKRQADALSKARIVDGLGEPKEIQLDAMAGLISDFKAEVDETDLDILCVTPTDRLRTELSEHNIPSDEISGRGRRLEKREDGRWEIAGWSQKSRNKAVHQFNNGQLDVMFLNGSGATGISMHPSPSNGLDLRSCTMIKAQLQREVTAERQIEGRISRYGQVHAPRYLIPMSGFAADDRLCQLFNRNNRSLTATSNASRENKSNISESLDLLNPVGELVVTKYLLENMQIANFLGIDATTTDGSAARKLMGRLVCLPIAVQEKVMADLDSLFQMEIDALSARGINPLSLSSYDWRAIVDTKAVLSSGDEKSSRMGDQPIKVVTLRFKERVLPRSYDEVQFLVEQGRSRWMDETSGRYFGPDEHVAAEEWNGKDDTEQLIDFDHPIFDQKLGRSTYDLLSGGAIDGAHAFELLDKLARQNGLDGAYVGEPWGTQEDNPARRLGEKTLIALSTAKIKDSGMTPNEIQVLRAVRQSLFLQQCLDRFQVGSSTALPQEICGALASTAIGRACAAQQHENDLLTIGVPAKITGISGPANGADMLNLGNWHLHLSVPGEENTISVSFASLYGGYSTYLENVAEDPSKYKALSFDFIVDDLTSMWAGEKPFPAYLDMSQILPDGWYERAQLVPATDSNYDYQVHGEIDRFRRLFDQAPAGEVNRERLAIMGNLFLGIKVAGKAFAEKIVFTNDHGESQHAILLKQNQKNLLSDLKMHVGALPRSISSVDPVGQSIALMQLYATLHKADVLVRAHTNGDHNNKQLVDAIDLISRTFRGDYSDGFREKVREKFPEIIERLARSVQSTTPSFIVAGSEPSGLSVSGTVSSSGNSDETWISLSRDRAGETDILAKLASTLGDKTLMLAASSTNLDNMPLVVYSRKNKLVKEQFADLGKDSANKLALTRENTIGRTLKASLSTTPSTERNLPGRTEQLLRTHVAEHDLAMVAYGGIRELDVVCNALSAELMREVSIEAKSRKATENKQDTQLGQKIETERDYETSSIAFN